MATEKCHVGSASRPTGDGLLRPSTINPARHPIVSQTSKCIISSKPNPNTPPQIDVGARHRTVRSERKYSAAEIQMLDPRLYMTMDKTCRLVRHGERRGEWPVYSDVIAPAYSQRLEHVPINKNEFRRGDKSAIPTVRIKQSQTSRVNDPQRVACAQIVPKE